MPDASRFKQSINKLHSSSRFILGLSVGALVYVLVSNKVPILAHVVLGWDALCLVILILSWFTFFTAETTNIREESRIEDSTRIVIFTIVIIATAASLGTVILLIVNRGMSVHAQELVLPVAVSGMFLSWVLVHTIFAIRYAHLFYADDDEHPEVHVGGLEFPGGEPPDFLDFAYFSFVLGMTFQVSDVEISSKRLRRLALLHGLISFGYNTVVVALTINLIAGLGGK